MHRTSRQRATAFLLFLLSATAASGQAEAISAWARQPGHVRARMIASSTSIQPGTLLTVGILFSMDPDWHIYWKNPGQSGLPTKIDWALPAGWSAGPLRWPVPSRFESSGIVTYGYAGDVLLTADLLPPSGLAAGSGPLLGARVSWLACLVECTPGSAALSLSLPVKGGSPAPDPAWTGRFSQVRDALPVESAAVAARRSGGTITLSVSGWSGALPVRAAFFPESEGQVDDSAPQVFSVSGESLRLELTPGSGSGPPGRLKGVLVVDPADRPGIGIDTAIVGDSARGGVGGLLAILFAFAGGLILNLMPCVLPVISIKVLSLVRNSREDGASRLGHSLLFSAGVVLSFLALGGVLVGLRSAGRLLGWGFQFQDPVVVGLTALLFFLVGLNLFGVFEVGPFLVRLGAVGNAAARSRPAGLRSFASGFFAALVATPCTAPFMGAAMGYALTSPMPLSFAVFAVLGLGLAAPYVALSLLPGLGARLPAPGRWMETLRQLMGFPMMAAVVWMLFVFAGLAGSSSVVALVGALLAAGLGAWILGRWGGPDQRRAGRAAAGILAFLLVAGAVGFVVARAGASGGAQAPVSSQAASAWEAWSPQKVADMRSAGRPVLIDFTARWCLSCTVNETVLDSPSVMSMLREKHVATLRADWTSPDASIAQAIASYGRAGVPLYVLYVPGRDDPVLLPEILTPGIVRAAVAGLG